MLGSMEVEVVEIMKKLKYTQGPIIDNMDALSRIVSGEEYVFLDGKPKHWKFMENVALKSLIKLVDHKRLRVAVPSID